MLHYFYEHPDIGVSTLTVDTEAVEAFATFIFAMPLYVSLFFLAVLVVNEAVSCAVPYVGVDLTIEDCSLDSQVNSFNWVPGVGHGCSNCGSLMLRESGLCVTVNGTNPSTGQPNLAIGVCDSGN